ncbi:MAG: ABC transporter permease [Methanosarcinaceae archaeon]|nr:ABC transporter permease [Methanosarcinaceae archaeon]
MLKNTIKDTIRDSIKVATWEVKKLVWNKTFIISLLLTPVIFGMFMGLPILFDAIEDLEEVEIEPEKGFTIYMIDEIGIYEPLSNRLYNISHPQIILKRYIGEVNELSNRIKGNKSAGFVHITQNTIDAKTVNIVIGNTSNDGNVFEFIEIEKETQLSTFKFALEQTLLHYHLSEYNINSNEINRILAGYSFDITTLVEEPIREEYLIDEIGKYVPGVFAGLILFMSVFSGMTTMQSAISDKKDKMVEILLSSVSADSLMYGKIIGNFMAGIIQSSVYLVYILIGMQLIGIPVALLIFLGFSPELPIMLFFALMGYLFFSSIYIGLGSTMEDAASAGNFQSIILSIPFFSFIMIGPVIDNPDGIISLIGSFIPFTAPLVMIIRLTISDLNMIDILLPAIVLIISTLIMAKITGKIFKTGMLMYGKNPNPKEIWKWICQ